MANWTDFLHAKTSASIGDLAPGVGLLRELGCSDELLNKLRTKEQLLSALQAAEDALRHAGQLG